MTEQKQMPDHSAQSALASMVKRRLGLSVSHDRLRKALTAIASIVAKGEHQYLPIFLRLESELASCVKRKDAIERAKSFFEEE